MTPGGLTAGSGGDPEREDLARRQAEVLAALLGQGPVPGDFDAERVRVEAAALHAKRRRVLTRLVDPAVRDALGPALDAHLDRWIRERPRRTGTGLHDDARAFTGALRRDGHLPRQRWWRRRASRSSS